MAPKPRSAEYFDGWYGGRVVLTCWEAVDRADEEAVSVDPGDDPALRSFHDEGVRSLEWSGLLRRVLAVATSPR